MTSPARGSFPQIGVFAMPIPAGALANERFGTPRITQTTEVQVDAVTAAIVSVDVESAAVSKRH